MIRFDYLNDPLPAFIDRVTGLLTNRAARAPLFALAVIVMIEASIGAVVHYRSGLAERELIDARRNHAVSEASLERLKIVRANVMTLMELDRRIQRIRESGVREGTRLVKIARRIPPRVWLVSLDDTGVAQSLVGRARRLDGVGDLMQGLAIMATGNAPQLIDASSPAERNGLNIVSFEVRLPVPHP